MKRRSRVLIGGLSVALTAGLVACSGEAEPLETSVIRMGVVPAETAEATLSYWTIFNELFEEETGMTIEVFEATSVPPVVEAAIAGDLDLMMVGPFAQILARDNGAAFETIGAMLDSPTSPNNTSVGLTLADSEVTSISDLRGEDVCFIDPGSATGYLFPAAEFLDQGIDPETELQALFVGDHISAVDVMADGECAAVFTFGGNEALIREPEKYRKLWETEVPNPGFSISTQLDETTRTAVVDAVLKINGDLAEERGLCTEDRMVPDVDGPICHAVGAGWGVEPRDDSYWEPLREVCAATKAPACEEG